MTKTPGLSWAGGCLESCDIAGLRRAVIREGGHFHEVYAPPGYAIDATFPSREQALRACNRIWDLTHRGLSPEEIEEAVRLDGDTPSSLFKWYAAPLRGFVKTNYLGKSPLYLETRRPLGRHRAWRRISREQAELLRAEA